MCYFQPQYKWNIDKQYPKEMKEDVEAQQLHGNNGQNCDTNGLFDGINFDKNLLNLYLNFNFNH